VLTSCALRRCLTLLLLVLSVSWSIDILRAQPVLERRAIERLDNNHRLVTAAPDGRVLALVIGIDAYKNFNHLNGAVADARDIEASLRRSGISEITTLIDAEVTRSAVTAAMERLIGQVRSGDLVIITYAGHGSQQPALTKTAENGGKDETFVLAGFAQEGAGLQERLLDKEIFAWLSQLNAKGATVIFLADSCHGGGMSKEIDPRIGHLSYRALRYVSTRAEASAEAGTYYIPPEQLALSAAAKGAGEITAAEELHGLTFVAAVDKWTESPEIRVPDEATPRGAVSYAFARAVEGKADLNNDGRITRRELITYIREKTQDLTERGQQPVFAPLERLDDVVLAFGGPTATSAAAKDQVSSPPTPAANAVIRVGVLNGEIPSVESLGSVATPFTLSRVETKGGGPDAVWDAANGDVVSSLGDVIARRVARDQLSGVVDRLAAVRRLALLAQSNSAHLSMSPSKRTYHVNEVAHLQIDGVDGRYLVIANISGNGKIQFVYPIPGDDPMVLLAHGGDSKAIGDIAIKPPFGSEVIVAIASRQRMAALEELLIRRNDQRGAREFVDMLTKMPADAAEITLLSFFTEP
jgi:Caspase domain